MARRRHDVFAAMPYRLFWCHDSDIVCSYNWHAMQLVRYRNTPSTNEFMTARRGYCYGPLTWWFKHTSISCRAEEPSYDWWHLNPSQNR
jgi:hypothetical protein